MGKTSRVRAAMTRQEREEQLLKQQTETYKQREKRLAAEGKERNDLFRRTMDNGRVSEDYPMTPVVSMEKFHSEFRFASEARFIIGHLPNPIPAPIKHNPVIQQFISDWFFKGVDAYKVKMCLIPKIGVDKADALIAIRYVLASRDIAHELKEEAVYYMITDWFDYEELPSIEARIDPNS